MADAKQELSWFPFLNRNIEKARAQLVELEQTTPPPFDIIAALHRQNIEKLRAQIRHDEKRLSRICAAVEALDPMQQAIIKARYFVIWPPKPTPWADVVCIVYKSTEPRHHQAAYRAHRAAIDALNKIL